MAEASAANVTKLAPPPVNGTGSAAETKQPTQYPSELPIERLVASKTNPRKNFDTAADAELVESVRRHGVLEPLLVRPTGRTSTADGLGLKTTVAPQQYEIVAGERRYRAAQKAKAPVLPVRVLELTDEQALEVQIVENLQRKDVEPIEEARGYAVLLDSMQKSTPTAKRSDLVEQLAKRIGKSVRYIYARAKLIELVPEAQKALETGKITASHADELVRLAPTAQADALKYCTEHSYGGKREQAPSIREFKQFLKEEVVVDLSNPPFKLSDATLLPAAGACTSCPKYSVNDPLAEKSKKVSCADPACFGEKRHALVAIKAAEVTKAKGVEPVLISTVWEHDKKKRIPGVLYSGESRDYWYDGGKHKTVKQNDCNSTKLAVYVDGEKAGQSVWVCTNMHNCPAHDGRKSSGGYTASVADERRKRAAQKDFRGELLQKIAAKVSTLKRADWELVAFEMLGHLSVAAPMVCKALGLDAKIGERSWDGRSPAQQKFLAGLSDADLQKYLLLFAIGGELIVPNYGDGQQPKRMLAVADRYKVDHAVLLADAKAKHAKKVPAKKAAAQTSAAPAKKGVCRVCKCTMAHACVLETKKGKPVTCKWADKSKTLCTAPACVKAAKVTAKPIAKKAAKKGGR